MYVCMYVRMCVCMCVCMYGINNLEFNNCISHCNTINLLYIYVNFGACIACNIVCVV